MPDPIPILHRLGDLEPGTTIQFEDDGRRRTGFVMNPDMRDSGASTFVYPFGRSWPNNTLVHRLIPETTATKHAGELSAAVKVAIERLEINQMDNEEEPYLRLLRSVLALAEGD